jgi:hypothetical protein
MEEIRKSEGLRLEELEAQQIELLPDREEMWTFVAVGNVAVAQQGAQAIGGQANQGLFLNF